MPSPKTGKAGTPVDPAEPAKAEEADNAEPGEVDKVKAEQRQTRTGKYGSVKTNPYKPPETEEGTEGKTSWIEIELVGEDNKGIPGERYRVILPDNSVAEGTLDPDGWGRVEGFEQGTCKVCFPDLDKEAWEFVSSSGPKSKSR